MADENVIKAVIDVSAPGAKETFQDVAKSADAVNESLKQLGSKGVLNVKSVGDAIGKLKTIISQTTDPQDLQKLNVALGALQNKAKDLPQAFEKVHVSSSRASSSAINLSHSLGILGGESSHLTHGLESLLFSFETMKEQTGSSTAALKGLAGVIGSGLGLGLAISTVSLLVENLFDTEDASKASEAALKSLGDEMDRVKGSVKSLSDELQFANQIGALDIKIRGASDLTDLLEQSFAQQGFTNDLRKQMGDLKDIRDKIDKEEGISDENRKKERDDNAKEIEDLNDKILDSQKKQRLIYKQIALQKVDDQKEADKKAKEQRDKALKQLQDDLEFEERLKFAMAKRAAENAKQRLKELNLDTGLQRKFLDIQGIVIPELHIQETDADKLRKLLEKQINPKGSKEIELKLTVKPELTADQKALQKSLDEINQQIQQLAASAITAFAEAIGTAFAGGDVENVFKAFVGVIGNALQSIGEKLILIGVTAKIAKEALSKLFENPALAIAAGIALVAIGAALKSSFNSTKGFAEGGFTGPGGKYEAAGLVHKGEFVMPAHSVNRLGVGFLSNLAFGNNIRGYANGGLVGAGNISGGGIAIEVTGETITRGQDIVTVYKAALRSQSRLT